MTQTEAVTAITEKVQVLRANNAYDTGRLAFYTEKLVIDILAYCHRDDFPDGLVYTAADLIVKHMEEESSDFNGVSVKGPLKSIKMDDTQFDFAVNPVAADGSTADADFDKIKPKLNRYRRVVSL